MLAGIFAIHMRYLMSASRRGLLTLTFALLTCYFKYTCHSTAGGVHFWKTSARGLRYSRGRRPIIRTISSVEINSTEKNNFESINEESFSETSLLLADLEGFQINCDLIDSSRDGYLPLLEPIRSQDLTNTTRLRTEKKNAVLVG